MSAINPDEFACGPFYLVESDWAGEVFEIPPSLSFRVSASAIESALLHK